MVRKTQGSAALRKALDKTSGKPAPQVLEDQTVTQATVTEAKSEKKAPSAQVARWKAEIASKSVTVSSVITVPAEHQAKNPKLSSARSKAGDRFAVYTNNMTVAEYQKICKDRWNRSPAASLADVRWDKAAGFILVS